MIQSYSTIIFAFWKIVCPAPFISFIAQPISHHCWIPFILPTNVLLHLIPKKLLGWSGYKFLSQHTQQLTLHYVIHWQQHNGCLCWKQKQRFKPRPRQRGDSRRLRRFESETWLKMTVKNHNTVVNVNTGQRVNGRGKPCSDTTLTHYLVKHILCSNEHNPGRSKGTYPNLPQNSTFADCVKVIWRNPAVENDMISHTLMGFSLREKTLNCRVQRPRSSLSGCRGVLF